jgi:hypothetical protein
VIRQSYFIAVVGVLLIGCAVLLVVGCAAGVRSEAPQKEEQGHTEATKAQQGSSSGAPTSEEARCEGTRTFKTTWEFMGSEATTNDIPGCPYGGLLLGTDGGEDLQGRLGDDEVHGLGGVDASEGGGGNDIIYGGPGDDTWLSGDRGDDVIYGGAGNEVEMYGFGGEDVLYGGDGNDILELNGMPRWVAFEERFIVAEEAGQLAAVARFREGSECLHLGLIVTDPWAAEGPLVSALYAEARAVAEELGLREVRVRTREHQTHLREAGYRRWKGGWRLDMTAAAG